MIPEEEVWEGRTIEVHGLRPSTTSDAIQLFFENKRRSGGDIIDEVKMDADNTVAYVTFHTPGGMFEMCSALLNAHNIVHL